MDTEKNRQAFLLKNIHEKNSSLDAYISEKQLRIFGQNPGILPFGK